MSRLSLLDRMAQWQQGWNPRMSLSLTSTKGLLNAPGQNNCFLNSAVQVLWHLDVFRRSFRMLSGHACMGNSCIFCALKVLFTQFQYSDRTSLPPDALRKALAKAFMEQQRFQMGLMDDAAECFENILLRIHFHIANGESEDMCNARHCIPHQKFAMTVVEQIVCQCGATSEPLPFSQTVYYVSASALVSEAKAVEAQGSLTSARDLFAQLVRNAVAAGDIRECPSNCGRKVQIRRNLTNCPDVVSLGLVWDSDRPSLDHIKDVVQCIGTSLRLPDLFHAAVEDTWSKAGALQLVGVVCYYGKHYSTFFFHSKMNKWVYFDDATVKEMGSSWQGVADKCCRGHYQPLLLLYANPESTPIPMETAPQITTMLPGHKFFNSPEDGGGSSQHQHPPARDGNGSAGGHDSSRSAYITHETSLRKGGDVSTPVSHIRRSRTPNPDFSSERVSHAVPRRAMTPNPTWGCYDSDEEEYGRKPDSCHFRQSSYLTAMENFGVSHAHGSAQPRDVYSHATAPPISMGSVQDPRWHQGSNQNQVLKPNPSANMSRQTHEHTHGYPQHAPAQNIVSSRPVFQGQSGTYVNQNNGIPKYNDWTSADSQSENSRHAQTGLIQPPSSQKSNNSSVAKVSEIQRIDSFKHNRYPAMDAVSDHSRQSGPTWNEANSKEYYADLITRSGVVNLQPSLKRTKSLENTCLLDEPDVPHHHHRPPVSKTRPQSARPYDYGRQRPVVDQTNQGNARVPPPAPQRSCSVPQQSRPPQMHAPQPIHPGHQPGLTGHPGAGLQQSHRLPSGPSNPGAPVEKPNWQEIMGEDPDATYISRKAVENIIQYQKNRNRPSSAGPVRTGPQHSSNSSLESCGKDPRAVPAFHKEILKVDIPDNASLQSQADSGYRSSSSGGDRNSASSASSASNDSPTIDSLRAYGHKDPGKPLFFGSGFDGKSHSSSENMSYAALNAMHNQLGKIPENLPTNELPRHGLAQSVLGHEDVDSDEEKDLIEFSLPFQGQPKGENCEQVCIRAEGLIEQSIAREKEGDLAFALALCTQAIGLLQQALNLPNANQDSKLHARVKHNSCVLRSRGLHRRIISRQDSSHSSDVSSEDHASLSSVNTEAEMKDFDLITLDLPPKDQYQMMQGKLGDLYNSGTQVANGQTMGVVMHVTQGSHKFQNQHPVIIDHKQNAYVAQCSSDSGYSTNSDSAGPGRLPHSSTDSVLNKRSKTHKAHAESVSEDRRCHAYPVDSDQDSNVSIYATLPRKGSKSARLTSQPPPGEVYQDYLQRQKQAHHQQGGSQENLLQPRSQQTPLGGFNPQGNHQHQNSNSSMSKQDIKKLLITEFMEHRQVKTAGDKPEVRPKPTLKPKPDLKPKPEVGAKPESPSTNRGHLQAHGMQYEDIFAQQMKGLSIKNHNMAAQPGHDNLQNCGSHPAVGQPRMLGGGRGYNHGAGLSEGHSRQSSASSSHTLLAHSRDNSLSSQGSQSSHSISLPSEATHHKEGPPPVQDPGHSHKQGHHLQSQRHYQPYDSGPSQQYGHANSGKMHPQGYPQDSVSQKGTYHSGNANPAPPGGPHLFPSQHAPLPAPPLCRGDVEPGCGQEVVRERDEVAPKPSVIGRLDRQYHQELERLASQQAPDRQSQNMQRSTRSDASTAESRPGNDPHRNKFNQAGQMDPDQKRLPVQDDGTAAATLISEPTHTGTNCYIIDQIDGSSHPQYSDRHPLQSGVSQQHMGHQPYEQAPQDQQAFHSSASYQVNLDPDFPPPPPCAYVVGGTPELEAEVTQNISHPSSPSHSQAQPDPTAPQTKKDPKSVLAKRKKGHRRKKHRPRKSVTFSDNIILIGTIDEAPPEIDYIAYVNKLQGNVKRHSTSSSSATSDLMDESDCTGSTISSNSGSSEVNGGRTGYDSDYDEETDDSAISDDDSADKIKCNLCRKKYIAMTELYCDACKFYMSQFQPQPS